MKLVYVIVFLAVVGWAVDTARAEATAVRSPVSKARLSPARLRVLVYRTHPCLAHIVDHEDGRWDPTISFGGGHNVYDSYGLGQANPGTKMASFGRDWRTNPWTQLRWMKAYANARYGSECGAWAAWQRQGWW